MTTKLISAGLDFLRVTSDEIENIELMFNTSRLAMQHDVARGLETKVRGMLGFSGRATRHCFFGRRQQWGMLQVSGGMAREMTNALLHTPGKATRIDLQLTLFVGDRVEEFVRQASNSSQAGKPSNGRHWTTTLIEKDGSAQTCYIGSRTSEWYGRIYDKFAESKEEEYKGCIRYEVEVKGDAARQLWDYLREEIGSNSAMVNIVLDWFQKHNIIILVDRLCSSDFIELKPPPSDNERLMGWLQKQVAPAVGKLLKEGFSLPVLSTLFRDWLSTEQYNSIMYMMTLD